VLRAGAVVDVLHSRVATDPDRDSQATVLHGICRRPRLVNRWAPPDLAGPAPRRLLTGYTCPAIAVVVSPDGSWLTSGGEDGFVRGSDIAASALRRSSSSRPGSSVSGEGH
jgi:hypothetical protein